MFTEMCQIKWQLSVHIVVFAQILDDMLIATALIKKTKQNNHSRLFPTVSFSCFRPSSPLTSGFSPLPEQQLHCCYDYFFLFF